MLLGELCRWSLGEEGLFGSGGGWGGNGAPETEEMLYESKVGDTYLCVYVYCDMLLLFHVVIGCLGRVSRNRIRNET